MANKALNSSWRTWCCCIALQLQQRQRQPLSAILSSTMWWPMLMFNICLHSTTVSWCFVPEAEGADACQSSPATTSDAKLVSSICWSSGLLRFLVCFSKLDSTSSTQWWSGRWQKSPDCGGDVRTPSLGSCQGYFCCWSVMANSVSDANLSCDQAQWWNARNEWITSFFFAKPLSKCQTETERMKKRQTEGQMNKRSGRETSRWKIDAQTEPYSMRQSNEGWGTRGKTALHFLKNRLSLWLPAAAQRHHGDRSEIGNMIG